MGKIRTKIIGLEEVEKKQAEKAKARREGKKQRETKVKKIDTVEEMEIKKTEAQEEETEEKKAVIKSKETKEAKETAKKAKSHGKNYRKVAKKVDKKKFYDLTTAVKLLRATTYAKFDQTVELHLNLKETGIKGEVSLPHGTGKKIKVAIVDDQVITAIDAGKIDFDVLIAAPTMMPRLVKYAKILGPRGLMPNPKTGTVTEKPEEAKKKFEQGTLRYKSEAKFPLLHQAVGKMSFKDEQLVENIQALLSAVAKKNIDVAFLSATMTPSVRIAVE